MLITTLLSSGGSAVKAQDLQAPVREAPGAAAVTAPIAESAIPLDIKPGPQEDEPALPAPSASVDAPFAPSSLAQMVDAMPMPAALTGDLECLAGAIYFEAKSESYAGRLAVGRVITARARSGRFPASYCGVVYQPSQFSFVHGRSLPAADRTSRAWQEAVKLALIADQGLWKSPVEGAMFFHAARVSPNWGKARMARIDNHVFYR